MEKLFDDVQNTKFLRSLNMLRFHRSDLEYHKKERMKRKLMFDSDLMRYMKSNNLTFSVPKAADNLDLKKVNNYHMLSDQRIIDDCKRLYKKLASITHPDKNMSRSEDTQETKLLDYKRCRDAFEKNDWFTLFEMALDYKLEIPKGNVDQFEWIEGEVSRIKEIIETIKSTYEWRYAEPSNDLIKKESIMVKCCMIFCINDK